MQVPMQEHHEDPKSLHNVRVKARRTIARKQHPISRDEESGDRTPDPRRKILEYPAEQPKALWRINANGGRPQDEKDEKEPANPDQRGDGMKRGSKNHLR